MTPIAFLKQAARAIDQIEALKEQIQRLDDSLHCLGRASSTESKVQSTPPKDPMGDRIVKIADRKVRLETRLYEWEDVLYEIESVLNELPRASYKTVLKMRYIDGKSTEVIADTLGWSIRHVKRLHAEGLAEIKVPA